jgi:methylthioribose-1-phosphate isomerase
MLPTIDWQGDTIVMIDQRKLPGQELYMRYTTAPEVARAIRTMVIRGAPAIGAESIGITESPTTTFARTSRA